MSDGTLYRWGEPSIVVADVEAVTGYDITRPMLGAIHEPPNQALPGVYRQALPFGSRQGTLELVLIGDDSTERAAAIDEALQLNALYELDMPHFAPLHRMLWAVAGDYSLTYNPQRGRRVWVLSVPVKEVLR